MLGTVASEFDTTNIFRKYDETVIGKQTHMNDDTHDGEIGKVILEATIFIRCMSRVGLYNKPCVNYAMIA